MRGDAIPPYLPTKYKKASTVLLKQLTKAPADSFEQKAAARALGLFQEMAARVPAYKDVLKKHRINPQRIKTVTDFKQLPLLDKQNYLRQYPLEKLSWDGKLAERPQVFAATSGSTGTPFYFPRSASQNWQYGLTAELYLRNNFDIDKKTTLYLNCFALGVWIGGIFTQEALEIVQRRGNYPLTVLSPGLNKQEILKAVKALGPHYDQVILGGYPPFVKDILDDGVRAGIDWKKYHLKFVFSAEGFTETFRDYVAKIAGLRDIHKDTLNHYGTVDQGTLAHETPLAVLIRRLALSSKNHFADIFRDDVHRIPTLAQYDPEFFFFEEVKSGLVCSSYSGLPLVRYDLKDYGGVIPFNEMMDRFRGIGIDLNKEIQKHNLQKHIWHLPFVYVYERQDFSVSVSGANVYPEPIRNVLQDAHFGKYITGKFTLLVESDKRQNQQFVVNLELKGGIRILPKPVEKAIQEKIVQVLLRENSEYRIIYEQKKKGALPHLVFWPYEHPQYFRVGGKQKWTLKLN